MRRYISLKATGIGLVALIVAVSAVGCPPTGGTLRVMNTTAKTITEVYCTPVNDPSWGPNLISGSIAPGVNVDITGFDPGQYDALAVFADDSEAEKDNINLVAGGTYSWNVLLSIPSGKSAAASAGGR